MANDENWWSGGSTCIINQLYGTGIFMNLVVSSEPRSLPGMVFLHSAGELCILLQTGHNWLHWGCSYECTHVFICVCVHACVNIYIYIYIYVLCVCMCVCVLVFGTCASESSLCSQCPII